MFSLLHRLALVFLFTLSARAGEIKRSEVLAIARTYAELRWDATPANVRHGADRAGVAVSTPSAEQSDGAAEGYWIVGQTNIGMPYKWGGYDSLASFLNGVKAGRAAGDLYKAAKRQQADAAVSEEAVGVDCSGFISRCWKLRQKYGTSNLPGLCEKLRRTEDLLPGDIMNAEGGHVMLFAEWSDATKGRARFYEANPFSKVRLTERSVKEMFADGYRPWRFRQIRD